MSNEDTLELVSFKICPFVQRSAIALNEKGVDYTTRFIDLEQPAAWFTEISPLGKVPVLKTDSGAIFESMVIAEYLDEVYEPRLHPEDPMEKARHRSWIEYASEVTMKQFSMFMAPGEKLFTTRKDELSELLNALNGQLSEVGPMFSGERFRLVDAAFAPVFMRLELLGKFFDHGLYDTDSRLGQWSQAMMEKDSVKNSVSKDFERAFLDYFGVEKNHISKLINQGASMS
ncbi:Glutathione S-transferase [hydrothermal vent metagenome]|uniref:glutathione transferase n=1 Tax=hydrothermal vent metagenome TaxID=652676 RepID=A0A3B0YS01_9ZZZZ